VKALQFLNANENAWVAGGEKSGMVRRRGMRGRTALQWPPGDFQATFPAGGRLDIGARRAKFPAMTHLSRSFPSSARSGRRGFTLLEIMIALAILSLLIGLAVSNLDKFFGDAQSSTAQLFVKESIKLPLTSYRIKMGDYPSTAEGLQALITAPAGKAEQWSGPYFADTKIPLDPWGEPYVYRYPGTKNKSSYDIFSKGPDKTEGTADDIGNW
jgi:general secretion pathway protein G